jgi:uncharacterized protein YjbJ (UPF0337 family)
VFSDNGAHSGGHHTDLTGAVLRALEDNQMNKEEIEGATQKGVGAVKDAVGKLTGNDKLRAEGLGDKIAGTAKESVGKVKDAVEHPKKD